MPEQMLLAWEDYQVPDGLEEWVYRLAWNAHLSGRPFDVVQAIIFSSVEPL